MTKINKVWIICRKFYLIIFLHLFCYLLSNKNCISIHSPLWEYDPLSRLFLFFSFLFLFLFLCTAAQYRAGSELSSSRKSNCLSLLTENSWPGSFSSKPSSLKETLATVRPELSISLRRLGAGLARGWAGGRPGEGDGSGDGGRGCQGWSSHSSGGWSKLSPGHSLTKSIIEWLELNCKKAQVRKNKNSDIEEMGF